MELDKVHELLDLIIRKETNGFVTHAQKDNALHLGQVDYYNACFEEYGRTQTLHDALSPFKTTYSFSNNDSPSGVVTLPSGYAHLLDGYVTVFDNTYGVQRKKITFVNEEERSAALESQLRPPSTSRPIGELNSNTIQLYPAEPMAGVVTYMKQPVKPQFAYNQSGRTITYNSGSSTQLLWSDLYIPKVVLKALSYLGVNLNEGDLVKYAEK